MLALATEVLHHAVSAQVDPEGLVEGPYQNA